MLNSEFGCCGTCSISHGGNSHCPPKPSNGLLILLLISYTPAVTVGVPNLFSVVAGLTIASTVLLNPASVGRHLLRPSQVLFAASAFALYEAVQTIFSENMTLAHHNHERTDTPMNKQVMGDYSPIITEEDVWFGPGPVS